jgi:hypothetical protein
MLYNDPMEQPQPVNPYRASSPAQPRRATNPFYVAVLPVGILFAITACAYLVMTLLGLDPQHAEATGLVRLMDRHGVVIMLAELALLGLLTVAAIATDDFWMRRFEAAENQKQQPGDADESQPLRSRRSKAR